MTNSGGQNGSPGTGGVQAQAGNGDPKNGILKNVAAFMVGITMFQVFYITLASAKFTLERFRIPPSSISIYVNRMVVSYRISSFLGVFFVMIYDLGYGKHLDALRRFLLFMLGLFYVLITFVYHIGGQQGHLTLFYWILTTAAFLVGSSYTLAARIATDQIQYLLVSLPVSKVWTFFYQFFFLLIWKLFRLSKAHYWMVMWQGIISIALSLITAGLWIAAYEVDAKKEDTEASNHTAAKIREACVKAMSPVLMSTLGFGLQNAVYPGVSPYKLTKIDQGFNITLAVLFTSGIPALANLGLTAYNKGPNVDWTKNKNWGWQFAWIFFFVQVACAISFISAMHYPRWPISQSLRGDARILGIVTVIYDLCLQSTYIIGTSAITKQGGQSAKKVSTVRIFTLTFAQITAACVGDGYVKVYSKYERDRDNWPTKHYGNRRAFWFWTWNATKVGLEMITNAYTTNVRGAVLRKKEYLFIVHENVEDNKYIFDVPKPSSADALFQANDRSSAHTNYKLVHKRYMGVDLDIPTASEIQF